MWPGEGYIQQSRDFVKINHPLGEALGPIRKPKETEVEIIRINKMFSILLTLGQKQLLGLGSHFYEFMNKLLKILV